MAGSGYFTKDTFRFLKDLAKNNEREWFAVNKGRYEEHVKDPALRFIQDFAPHLRQAQSSLPCRRPGPSSASTGTRASPRTRARTRPTSGIQFRHDRAKDAHAPGYYFHIEPGTSFVGLGLWHPDGPTTEEDPGAHRRGAGRVEEGVARPEVHLRVRSCRGQTVPCAKGLRPGPPPRRGPDVEGLHRVQGPGRGAGHESLTCPRSWPRYSPRARPDMAFLCDAVGVPF